MADVSGGRSTPTPDMNTADDRDCPCAHYGGCADGGGCEGNCGCGEHTEPPPEVYYRPPVGDTTDLEQLLPWTVIEDVNGDIWQKRERRYGSSWYQPGDGQPHGTWDIAQPVTVISEPECSCAMTESSMTSCPLHGYDAPEDGATQPQPTDEPPHANDVDYPLLVAEIRALHQQNEPSEVVHIEPPYCVSCLQPWPCETATALDKAGCL